MHTMYVRKGKVITQIRSADGEMMKVNPVTYDSINKAKKESRSLQSQHGHGCLATR